MVHSGGYTGLPPCLVEVGFSVRLGFGALGFGGLGYRVFRVCEFNGN